MKPAKPKRFLNRQIVFIILFAVVSLLSTFNPYFKLDLQIARDIQSVNSVLFQKIMCFFSSIGNQPYMLLIIGATSTLLCIYKQKTEAVISSLAAAGSALSGSLIKMLIDRPRPA